MSLGQSEPSLRLLRAMVAVIIVLSGIVRVTDRSFQRPIDLDEWITLQDYTWAGVHADGARREMAQTQDLENLHPAGESLVKRFLIGLYCGAGRWTEPNNHVPHSLLTSFSLLLPGSTMSAIRWPALVACCIFAALSAELGFYCGMRSGSLAVALLAMWHPYCQRYSQESRGYALMLVLCVALVFLLTMQLRRPRSLLIAAGTVAVAYLGIINIVSLSVDFILPLMAASWLLPAFVLGASPPAHEAPVWKRSLFIQLLVVGALGFVFLLDRLPYVFSSMKQYGASFQNSADLQMLARELHELFVPGPVWPVVLIIGLAGGIAGYRQPALRPMIGPWMAACLVSAAHFVLGGKFPYARNFGYLLPPLIFGFGIAFEALARRNATPVGRWLTGIGGFGLIFLAISTNPDRSSRPIDALRSAVESNAELSDPRRILLLGPGVPDAIRLSIPHQTVTSPMLADPQPLELMLIEKKVSPFRWRGTSPPGAEPLSARWMTQPPQSAGLYEIWRKPVQVRPATGAPEESNGLALWLLDFKAVAVTPEPVEQALSDAGLAFRVESIRYQAKLDVYQRANFVLVDLQSSSAGSDALARLNALAEEYGGLVYLLAD